MHSSGGSGVLVLLRDDFLRLTPIKNDIRGLQSLAVDFFTLMVSYRHTISLVAKYAFRVTEIFEATPMHIPPLPLHWLIQPQVTD